MNIIGTFADYTRCKQNSYSSAIITMKSFDTSIARGKSLTIFSYANHVYLTMILFIRTKRQTLYWFGPYTFHTVSIVKSAVLDLSSI